MVLKRPSGEVPGRSIHQPEITTMKSTTAAPKAPAKKTATAKPIPEGMHSLTPHLVCAGAAKAIEFYKKAFGATELVKLASPDGKLMHGSVQIGDSRLMLV